MNADDVYPHNMKSHGVDIKEINFKDDYANSTLAINSHTVTL